MSSPITWAANRDARTTSLPYDAGSGAPPCYELPVGTYQGYDYQSHIGFAVNWVGIPNAGAITSVLMYIVRGFHEHVAPTACTVRVRAMVSNVNFNEGTAGHPLSPSNAMRGSTRGTVDAANAVTFSSPVSPENAWIGPIDITDMVVARFGASAFAVTLSADSGVTEFRSHEVSAGGAFIRVYYNENSAPTAPTLNSPIGGALVSSQTPTLSFTPHDPDGDAHTKFYYQVDDNSTFSSPLAADNVEVVGSMTNGVPKTRVVQTTLVRGGIYYWRVKTADAGNGYGPYANTWFKVMAQPTNSVSDPPNGETAHLYYTAGSATTPKLVVGWNFACADGHAQTQAIVHVYDDAQNEVTGSPWTFNQATKTANISGFAPTNGTYYKVAVQCRCAGGIQANLSPLVRTRVRWGRASYYTNADPAKLPVASWATPVVNATIPGNAALIMEYACTTSASTYPSAPASEPTTWYSAMSLVPIPGTANNTYIWHRVTMFGWGTATPTSPTLADVTLRWNTTGKVADGWTYGAQYVVDESDQYYGTQSLRATGNGSVVFATQEVDVLPDTMYVLSGRIKTVGDAQALIRVDESDGSGNVATAALVTASQEWGPISTPVFNSGSRTKVLITLRIGGAAGTFAWFDALKLEASLIVTPWTPGFVGSGVTIDAGGVQIDSSNGGLLRLRGSSGGARDVIQTGTHGLSFGGDVTLYSDTANVLKTDDALTAAGMASGAYTAGGSSTNVVVTTAGTYYFMTSVEVSFTPSFVGQKFEFTYTGFISSGTSITDYCLGRLWITDSSNNQIGSSAWYGRSQFSASTNSSGQMAITGNWTADAASARKVRFYVTMGATNGATITSAYTNLTVKPLLA